MVTRSEKSAEAVVAAYTGRRAEGMGGVITELSKARGLRCSCVKLATNPARVKPSMVWQRDNQFCRTRIGETGNEQEGLPAYYLNCANRPVRTRMPGGVGGVQSIMAAPYPDWCFRALFLGVDRADAVDDLQVVVLGEVEHETVGHRFDFA